jgi:divinyl protochlorophyllide a 8-vinyl-reductase
MAPHELARALPAAPGAAPAETRIGPNAVTRLAEALHALEGAAAADAVFRRAGCLGWLDEPPTRMVPEGEVVRLQRALFDELGVARARRVARDAGTRTAAYLLARRIPAPARALLRALPAPLASRFLARAIARHAWTFAGSAGFAAHGARPVSFTLTGCPMCRGARAPGTRCDFYTGCFERLCRALVHRRATVTQTACAAAGAPACRFEVDW